jgi:hypothetical protein
MTYLYICLAIGVCFYVYAVIEHLQGDEYLRLGDAVEMLLLIIIWPIKVGIVFFESDISRKVILRGRRRKI